MVGHARAGFGGSVDPNRGFDWPSRVTPLALLQLFALHLDLRTRAEWKEMEHAHGG